AATESTAETGGAPPEATAEVDSATWAEGLKQAYLDELPDTDEKIAASDTLIHRALMRVGNTYRDELLDNAAAIHTYEELLTRYPSTADAPLLYYNLYRLYTDIDATKM